MIRALAITEDRATALGFADLSAAVDSIPGEAIHMDASPWGEYKALKTSFIADETNFYKGKVS
jgi:hypothetical protein